MEQVVVQAPSERAPQKGKKRGPKPNEKVHRKIYRIVAKETKKGNDWQDPKTLQKICRQLDEQRVEHPETWPGNWCRTAKERRHVVVKKIQYSLDMVRKIQSGLVKRNSR